MKYIAELRSHFSNKPVFSVRDIRTHFSKQRISSNYIHVLLNHLLKRKEVFRVSKGFYSFSNDPNVIVFAVHPSYFGLQDALSFHGLWEQETIPVIITPRKVRAGFRNVFGSRVLVRKISRKMFFGFELVKHNDYWLPVSDIEKTLVDFFYFSQPLDKKVLKKILKRMDKKKLAEYLKKVPEKTLEKIKKRAFGKVF